MDGPKFYIEKNVHVLKQYYLGNNSSKATYKLRFPGWIYLAGEGAEDTQMTSLGKKGATSCQFLIKFIFGFAKEVTKT